MIAKLVVYRCRKCDSQKVVKNGHNASGSQQYWCKDCGHRGVLEPKRGYTEEQKEQILSAYSERSTPSAVRGIQRTFGVSRPTQVSWRKKRTKPVQNLKKRSCPPNLKMSWKPMKCGHLSRKNGTNVGCGQSCAAELAKLWHLCSETEARRAVANCGNKSH